MNHQSLKGTLHLVDPLEVRHVEQHAVEGAHRTYAQSGRRDRIRPGQGGLTPPEHEIVHAILGVVNFLCMCTIHDIAFAISVISARQTAPTQLPMKQLKCHLRYLNGTRPIGLTYGRPSHDNVDDIKVFSDSNWAADTTTIRSQSGEGVMHNGGAVTWTSKQQEVVALSST
jgi:hypothetical protein